MFNIPKSAHTFANPYKAMFAASLIAAGAGSIAVGMSSKSPLVELTSTSSYQTAENRINPLVFGGACSGILGMTLLGLLPRRLREEYQVKENPTPWTEVFASNPELEGSGQPHIGSVNLRDIVSALNNVDADSDFLADSSFEYVGTWLLYQIHGSPVQHEIPLEDAVLSAVSMGFVFHKDSEIGWSASTLKPA